jgi:glycine dehydrogenase subunit 1
VPGFSRRFAAPVFNELAIQVPEGSTAKSVLAALQERQILGGVDLGRWYPELAGSILMTATEVTTDAEIETLATALGSIAKEPHVVRA